MTVEVTPGGIACNLSCTYCYQHNLRDAGNFSVPYDFDAIKKTLDTYYKNEPFTLFGGEILLTPKKVLEELFQFGLERSGTNAIQTNGVLITDEHIELFKKYNVHIGFSFDGEDELNDLRWAGSLERTRENTKRTLENLAKCIENGVSSSAILTLHHVNVGTNKRLEKFKLFLKKLDLMGVNSIRLHDLEVDTDLTAKKHVLSPERNKEVFLELAEFSKNLRSLHVDVFWDIKQLLIGDDREVTCLFRACDPYTTAAVQEVTGDGSLSNCGRTIKEGINWKKSETPGFERYVALYQTPQEYGGCNGCRFFLMCKGNCPGGAMDEDWRNKTQSCEMWFNLFEHFEGVLEEKGVVPLSKRLDRQLVEEHMLKVWMSGNNINIYDAVENVTNTMNINIVVPTKTENVKNFNGITFGEK